MPLNVWGFAAITVPLVATPGASTAVVLRNSLAGGVRSGIATADRREYRIDLLRAADGVRRGGRAAALAAGVGGAARGGHRVPGVARRPIAAPGVDLSAARRARRGSGARARRSSRSLREGFVTNVLNPSLATFYLLILPQFIPRGAPPVASALTLTAFHVSLALTWHLTWAAAGGTLSETLGRTRPRRILEGISGAALLGLALKLAL